MKALTICQPYAHLIAIGEKRVENRTWPTSYRGPIAIHAGKSKAWLTGDDPEHMDFGAVVAIANLVECLAMRRIERNDFNIIQYPWLRRHQHTEGPWCWVLENVRMLETPISWKGAQGLWEFDESALPYNGPS